MPRPLRVLYLYDEPNDVLMIEYALHRAGFIPVGVRLRTLSEYLSLLDINLDVIFSDWKLENFSGLQALRLLQERGLDVPFIFVAAVLDDEKAVEAVRQGADDYVFKERLGRLGPAVACALERRLFRRAQQETQRQIARLAAIVRSSEDAIFSIDLAGLVTDWNPGAERLYGYKAVEILGQHVSCLVPEERLEELTTVIQRILQGEHIPSYETQRRRKDGSLVEVSVTVSPLHDAAGQVVGISAIAQDITARKRAEEAARRQEARQLAIVEAALDAIITIDAAGQIVAFNAAAERIFGYRRQEALGRPAGELLVPPALREQYQHWLERAVAGALHPVNCRNETTLLRSDGTEFPAELTIAYLPGEEPPLLTAFIRDLTDFKKIESQRLQLTRQLELLLQSTGEGICGVDAEGRCTFLNRAGAELLGYQPEEVLGRYFHDLAHHSRPDRTPYPREECPLHRSCQRGEVFPQQEEIFWRKDGTPLPVACASWPVRNDGIQGAVIVFKDITEIKKMEAQMMRAQKLEAIGRLAGGVAHDFNNLLTIINGYAEILLTRLSTQLTPSHRELLQEILTAGQRAASLTRQLLAFSRQQIVQPQLLDFHQVVRDTEKMLRRIIGEDILLHTQTDAEAGIVRADPGQLVQILMNLVVNARDAMPRGGQLWLSSRNVTLGPAAQESPASLSYRPYVLLEVRDTGVGMTPEVLAHIFEPFFTTKEPGKGTGLGLAVVHGVVEQAGGHIDVDSAPGQGTTFRIYLPRLNVVSAAPPAPSAAGELPRGQETILLIEDETGVRQLLRHSLQQLGYTVLEAGNAEEALALAQRPGQHLDLIVTDVVMPGWSGPEAAAHLRRLHPGVRLLFLSGYTGEALSQHGLQDQNAAFLQKPFTLTALAQKIRDILNQR